MTTKMKRMKLGIVFMILAMTACASATKIVRTADTAVYVAITTIDDAEWAAYQNKSLTQAQHDAVNPKISELLRQGQRFNKAVQQNLPTDLAAVTTALQAARTAIDTIVPAGAVKDTLDSKLDAAAAKITAATSGGGQ